MIAGFLSDAHGNPEGLLGCLRALRARGAERVYFLGDAVGYFPEEAAVLDLLGEHGAVCLKGNHEAMLLGELPLPPSRDTVYRLSAARERLAPSHRAWITEWPDRRALDLDGMRVLLVHGSPAEPLTGYVYPDADRAAFRGLPFDLVVTGHTHRPFLAAEGRPAVLNDGSCGMPRDIGHLASCALLDTAARTPEILRVPFDVEPLLARWDGRIDPSAAACLRRGTMSPSGGTELA